MFPVEIGAQTENQILAGTIGRGPASNHLPDTQTGNRSEGKRISIPVLRLGQTG